MAAPIDELKNLVLQSLEGAGVLGQIRAHLRSCVFKIVEQQDPSSKSSSYFMRGNPLAQKATETETGKICAELIKEYMEFYHLDYSLNIFTPELNLANQPVRKDEIQAKLGLSEKKIDNCPVLFQIISTIMESLNQPTQKLVEKVPK